MTLPPILAALKKHKAGVVLISLQIALTLAIVCNAIFIINQRVERIHRPTGLDEANLFQISQLWVNAPTGNDQDTVDKLDAMQRTDVEILRQLPDVESVVSLSSLPLSGNNWSGGVRLEPDQKKSTAHASFYFGDWQMLHVLGLQLVAGRDFTSADQRHRGFREKNVAPVVIITQALADALFADGQAVGKQIYLDSDTPPSTIIGVVARLQTPTIASWAKDFAFNSILIPARMDGKFCSYVVRAKPGRLEDAMREAPKALFAADPMRVIDTDGEYDDRSMHAFAEIRSYAYRADRGMAILMALICAILLCVTAAGIVGLTSFWVGQRRKQIGIRRALGATRSDILRYFQTENLLIAGAGVVLGAILAVGLNLWMMKQFAMDRMSVLYVLAGIVVLLGLGQGAVFAPARRAASVPPVVATRSV